MKTANRMPGHAGFFRSLFFFCIVAGLMIPTVFFPVQGNAQGNLLILPGRVVFEGSKKAQELTLANTGTDTAKYVVSVVQMRMKEDGSFEPITVPDSGQFFADKYFRFFPRTVTIPPGKSQVVKMQLVKPSKMDPGEYRSHLYFRSVPQEAPLGQDPALKDSAAVTVRLTPIFGITIPAIIRSGDCSAKVTLGNLSVETVKDTVTTIKMMFTRSGNISVYGDISVDYIAPSGKVTKVAAVKGIAVYTPNTLRTFQCNLDKKAGVDYHKGKLHILYTAPEDVKSAKLAEADLVLH
jgi:hypothetical protein